VGERGVADPGRLPPDSPPDVVVRRAEGGWVVQVGSGPASGPPEELATALTLADLLTAGAGVPGPRPPRVGAQQDELERLRGEIRQLEHALASRVLVEQAIGVLTERWRVPPREAFEHLRRVTRSRGVRIHELAREVVESCTDAAVRLPAELVTPPWDPRTAGVPPQPRRSQDPEDRGRRERPEQTRSRPDERQRQRGRRRGGGGGAPRPREPLGDQPGHAAPGPPRPADGPKPFPGATGLHGPAAVVRAPVPPPA
jgi:hypothetical protein